MMLPGIFSHMEKFEYATAENSVETFKKAIEAIEYIYQCRIIIKSVNTDRGSQFYSNKGGKSLFQQF